LGSHSWGGREICIPLCHFDPPIRVYCGCDCFGRSLWRPTIASSHSRRHHLGGAAGLSHLYISVRLCLDEGVKRTSPACPAETELLDFRDLPDSRTLICQPDRRRFDVFARETQTRPLSPENEPLFWLFGRALIEGKDNFLSTQFFRGPHSSLRSLEQIYCGIPVGVVNSEDARLKISREFKLTCTESVERS
jgi:hypothetical protein